MQPATIDAYRLLHDGAITLASIESRGVRIDTEKLEENRAEVRALIKEKKAALMDTPIYKAQRRRYGPECNIGSREQLAIVLFKDLKYPYPTRPGAAPALGAKGQYLLDEAVLRALELPYANDFLAMAKLEKLEGTYLSGVAEQTANGRLHCFFNLHKVITYRSSSSDLNFQNIPIRDQTIASYIRSCFVPEPGGTLIEIDISGAEVRVAACYHKDPTMIEYIQNDYDMHSAMGKECFLLEPADIKAMTAIHEEPAANEKAAKDLAKAVRGTAKGAFVFAEFYGDYHVQVAKNLWFYAEGLGLREHLASKGLGTLEKFTTHIKEVERRFWKERFPVYDAWRTAWWKKYLQWGHFHTLTGFRVHGCFTKNEVINNPVQGSAFHCLLASLIEVDRRCRQYKLKARIVGQIHDSMLCSVPKSEVAVFTAMVHEVMHTWLPKKWPWLIVPLEVDMEASDVSWQQKKKIKMGAEYGTV